MSKGLHRESESRTRILGVALDLFHKQGVHATSVDEILKQSGTGKSQFYHYFKSKEGLVHAVLQYFYELLKTNRAPMKSKVESWEDLEEWFGFFLGFQRQVNCERSCPIGTIGNDLSNGQELLRQDVRLIFDLMSRSLVDFFNVLKGRKQLAPGVDAQALADFCLCIMQGGLLVGKVRRDTHPFENSVHHAVRYLKTLTRVRAKTRRAEIIEPGA